MATLSSIYASRNLNVGTPTTTPTPTPGGGSGGAVVSGNAATFDTLADLQNSTIQSGVNTVRTMGYYAIGDNGGADYRRKDATEPVFELDRASNGGAVKWELIPERMEIWLESAGAKPPSGFNNQDNDCYPAFRAIDKFAAAKGLVGYTLRIDNRLYYSSKAWQFKRITTKVVGTHNGSASGGGTIIRFPEDQCGFITNYKWGMGHDYMMAIANWTFPAPDDPNSPPRGICVYSGANGGVPDGSCYRVVSPGTAPSNGAAGITSVTPNVDIPWGTMTLRYDGNIITDPVQGGGTMDYDCGADDNHSAGGCLFENIQLWGYFDGQANFKWRRDNAGIIMRVRGQISNCFALGFAGHGIACIADGDPDLGGPGNANGFYVEHCSAYWNGRDGFHFGWSNGNAGTAICLDTNGNGRWGVAEWSFLGNSITGVESATDGRAFASARENYPQCQYQGWIYMARLPILGSGEQWPTYKNENPTTNSTAWIKYYKVDDDLVNAQQVVTSTRAGKYWLDLGAAPSGKQTLTAAGVASNDIIWFKITDGANWEIGTAVFYAAGFDAGVPVDLITREKKTWPKTPGGIVASSAPKGADGMYTPHTLSPSAVITALIIANNYQDAAYWDPSIQFEPAGCYSTVTWASRSVWNYIYIEGGTLPAQWCYPTLVLGGMLNNSYDGTRGVIAFDDGKMTSVTAFTDTIMPSNAGARKYVSLGQGNQILNWTSYVNSVWGMRHASNTSGDIIFENQNIGQNQYTPVWRIGSDNTYGRSGSGDWGGGNAPMQISRFVLGNGGADGRSLQMGSGPPTSGYHAKGEYILNDGSGSDNTTFLWRCTAAGTPGTWAARA